MLAEDLDAFLFEFDILCRSYNYVNDAQKLKLLPTALKDVALRWFMGLGEYTIRTWDEIKSYFLKNIEIIVNLRIQGKIFLRCSNKKTRVSNIM